MPPLAPFWDLIWKQWGYSYPLKWLALHNLVQPFGLLTELNYVNICIPLASSSRVRMQQLRTCTYNLTHLAWISRHILSFVCACVSVSVCVRSRALSGVSSGVVFVVGITRKADHINERSIFSHALILLLSGRIFLDWFIILLGIHRILFERKIWKEEQSDKGWKR